MKITVATPMYGGSCDGAYTSSMLKAQRYFDQKGIDFEYVFIFNESLIQRARNKLATNFLNSDSDYLMFIDADIQFEPQWIEELINADKDLIGGVYPMKGLYLDYMIEAANAGKQNVEQYSGYFSYNPIKGANAILDYTKPYEVARTATGFMLISRKVLEEMKPHCESYSTNNATVRQEQIAFFNVRIKDGNLLSEDYDFCERWREMGNKVWIAPWVCTQHRGTYTFKGSLPHHVEFAKEIALKRILAEQNK